MFTLLFLSIVVQATATTGFPVLPIQPQPDGQPPAQTAPQPGESEQPGVVPMLQSEAELLKPLTSSKLCWSFLGATATLPDPGTRAVMRNKDKGITLTPEQFEKLPEADRAGYVKRELQPRFYYYTGYGTPLMYARPLDLLAENDKDNWAPDKLPSKRILDFGCGTIGHLRLLASLGTDVTGVDVEPLFEALYSQPGDQGEIQGPDGKKGRLRFLTGQWPADGGIAQKVKEAAGDGFDAFISKNTLKRGYIHPARYADPSRLVHLGVEDEAFVKAVYDSLKPGGIFLIYNISPRQAPVDKPYIPHADGECPFPREMLEKTGFEVVKFDENDQDEIVKYWMALGYNEGKDAEGTKNDLFAWWTMCRKPAKRSDAGTKGEIRITRNYAAEYNAEIAKIPEEERAWPLYLEARKRLVPPTDRDDDRDATRQGTDGRRTSGAPLRSSPRSSAATRTPRTCRMGTLCCIRSRQNSARATVSAGRPLAIVRHLTEVELQRSLKSQTVN
jgi:SAM-dependent methyltransferase